MKMTKLQRSQKAHSRLLNYYDKKASEAIPNLALRGKMLAKRNYHAECINIQQRKHKVLSKRERTQLWNMW